MTSNIWKELSAVDVSNHLENKNGLTYISWAWAWAEVKKRYPNARYTIQKNENGMPYFLDDAGAFCYVSVTIEDLTHEMWLPVLDNANKSMKREDYTYEVRGNKKTCQAIDTMAINKTLMRCLTKCLAMFGLGHYIYAGEDLPEQVKQENERKQAELIERYKQIRKSITDCTSLEVLADVWSLLDAKEKHDFKKLKDDMKQNLTKVLTR